MIGRHDFSGQCAPGPTQDKGAATGRSFSVGIFEVLPRASGKGTKRGPVKVRVKGPMSDPEAVFARARLICAQLDAGTYTGPKSVTV
jgi:hypothetical protein